MALIRALGGGGSSIKCEVGTFTATANDTTQKIPLGFKPRKLSIYFVPNYANEYPVSLNVYDEDVTSQNYWWRSRRTSGVTQVDRQTFTGNNPLYSIDDDGFTVLFGSSGTIWNGTWHYIAVG